MSSEADKLKDELLALLEAKEREVRFNKFSTYFPDTGPFSRDKYPKHILAMDAGADYFQRAIIGANRVGKTDTLSYEYTAHLTGLYPEWWKGRRFLNPPSFWFAGETAQSTRDILQKALIGDLNEGLGTGMIPKHLIVEDSIRKKSGAGDFLDSFKVRHVSGDFSEVGFKTYEQGRESFQGTKKDGIWLDEEPRNKSIFTECIARLADKFNPGMLTMTFMPIYGLSDILLSFAPGGKFMENGVNPKNPAQFAISISWDDCPHLNEVWKKQALEAFPAHERRARALGLPGLGSGAIYPYPEEDVTCDPFKIPDHWPKAYGLDVGWNKTAACWGAMDPDTRQIYLYSEHYESFAQPTVHAKAIKARGDWIRGVIDIASSGSSQADGRKLADLYSEEGLWLEYGNNTIEAGFLHVGQMLATGQLKIFSTLGNLLDEYRVYRRDENGKVVKKRDHLMDAMRYLLMSFDDIMSTIPDGDYISKRHQLFGNDKNDVTGY
ncbi:Terminase-like family [uncultured Caudovirales phage]|uniref:Terminase-like family n=1 Tax=uncultured Caudovirales phage TaxID=2100421 RepID=A0A6J5KJE2_9CAUD|nr:Terminase-like family [uncultured Caudovirales phage]